MPVGYNLSLIADNSTSILGLTQGVNTVLMEGWLGVLLLFGILSVMLIAYWQKTEDAARAISVTAFIGFVLAVLLRSMALITNTQLIFTIILFALAMVATNRSS